MKYQKSAAELAKFLRYVLGRKPDEFGLVPDAEGFFRIKDLLKALSEEEGWRHVRQGMIRETALTLPDAPVEIAEHRIRAAQRDLLPRIGAPVSLPRLLFTCIRRKAHPVVSEKGVPPTGGQDGILLSSEKEMAHRLGRRFDPAPVTVTVNTDQAGQLGVVFRQYGEILFLADAIPPGCFTVPSPPKEKTESKKKEKKEKKPVLQTPGSFFPDLTSPEEKKEARRKQKEKEKKRDRQRRDSKRRKYYSDEDH